MSTESPNRCDACDNPNCQRERGARLKAAIDAADLVPDRRNSHFEGVDFYFNRADGSGYSMVGSFDGDDDVIVSLVGGNPRGLLEPIFFVPYGAQLSEVLERVRAVS